MNQTSRSFRDVRILSTADFLQEEAQVHSFIHSFIHGYLPWKFAAKYKKREAENVY